MKCILPLLIFLLPGWPVLAATPAGAEARKFSPAELETFEGRQRAVLETCADDGSDKFIRAECLFALRRNAEALTEVNRALDPLVPGNKINRWMHGGNTGFIAWPGIDCYIRFEKLLDAATKERYRKIYTGGVFYARLSTSNHKIMAALTRYLATQVWGTDAFHADPYFMDKDPYIIEMTQKSKSLPPGEVWGTHFGKDDPTGEKYLRNIIAATVRGGPGEFASRPYGAQNVLPLLSLADCAKDPAMAAQARIAYEVCMAQLAPAWMRGHLATFAPRSYPDAESQQPWGLATLPWLYFGGVSPDLSHAKAAAAAAVSSYRIPAVIVTAATNRFSPYSYRALINGWALNHYVNRTYVLYSRSAKVGGKPWQGQSYPCGVMWEEPDTSKCSHLWITNPAADDNASKDNGPNGLHTHGVTSFEQEVQFRDAQLFVFNIPQDFRNPYALGFIPGGYRASLTATNRIFLHYGSVLIAIASATPLDWNPKSGIRAPAGKPREGDSEFRVKDLKTAIAIETAAPSDFVGATPAEQLAVFRDAVLAKSRIEIQSTGKPTGRYTDRAGNLLECTFDGADRINGDQIDYAEWPALENPWMRQQPGGPLKIRADDYTRIYDFEKWHVKDVPEARP